MLKKKKLHIVDKSRAGKEGLMRGYVQKLTFQTIIKKSVIENWKNIIFISYLEKMTFSSRPLLSFHTYFCLNNIVTFSLSLSTVTVSCLFYLSS